ncbi:MULTISPECIES: DUF4160 domain-containing protein [Microcystis]|uniref:DUF4160 domain-containing protein n=1 Tax=Microcystis TaxID=1125 RepID=UPI001F550595|nr:MULTISPECIES: DUF4160 domain-containing protein [Microcystis]UZO75541.1 DUF4160 domain-containing protein [Microcystis aeruginosa str. Chao 1910]
MPEITRFYGIIIKIFFADHPPPHFHAIYGEYNAIFNLETLEIIRPLAKVLSRSLYSNIFEDYQLLINN